MPSSKRSAVTLASRDAALEEVDQNVIRGKSKKLSKSPIKRQLRRRSKIKPPARFETYNFLNAPKRQIRPRARYTIDSSEDKNAKKEKKVVNDEDEDAGGDGVEALRRRNIEDNKRFLAEWRNERGEQ